MLELASCLPDEADNAVISDNVKPRNAASRGLQCSNAVAYLLLPDLLADPLSKVLVVPQFVEKRAHDPRGVYLSRERELLEESMLLPIQIEREANGLRRPGWWSAPASWLVCWLR